MTHDALKEVAQKSLSTFTEIEELALQKLSGNSDSGQHAIIHGNSMAGWMRPKGTEVKSVADITAEVRAGYHSLVREPAIARIEVEDEEGKVFHLFISRKSSLLLRGDAVLASYDSPLGRVASFAVGDDGEVTIRGERHRLYVRKRIIFHPGKDALGWDSQNNVWTSDDDSTISIASLRSFLGPIEETEVDALEALLALEDEASETTQGIAHQVLTAMALRDQPILDRFQDEIFRLPLDSQLLILGPPGTGKTTTLIKRLGQKISVEGLENAEQVLIGADTMAGMLQHRESWVMFTPTELLRHYLKEAFNREQIPADGDRIRTWEKFRGVLARNVLGLLKTNTGGRFVLSKGNNHVNANVKADARELFDDFQAFHRQRVLTRLQEGLSMAESASPEITPSFIVKLAEIVRREDAALSLEDYARLQRLDGEIDPALKESSERADKLLRGEANRQVNRNPQFLSVLGAFIESLQIADDDDDEESEFDTENFDGVSSAPAIGNRAAFNAYEACIRAVARSQFRKRSVAKQSRAGRIRDWLGERMPDDEKLLEIGRLITWQNGLRRFRNAWRRHVMDVGVNYRSFRKTMADERRYYDEGVPTSTTLDSTELDLMILAMLRNARELLQQDFVRRDLNHPRYTELARIHSHMRNQVLVDEATDFSVLQLACMESLANPRTRSFFACGDFNQRITSEGIHSIDQVRWLSDRLVDRRITTVYRQSAALNHFARRLVEVQGGDVTTLGELSRDSAHIGVPPMLLEQSASLEQTSAWLAERVKEIEQSVRVLPTIAVLVGSEDDVVPTAKALTTCLDRMTSLQARACKDGEVLGDTSEVRVFDIRHIKGLEFEAVFFVGVDEIARKSPELFDRYLYVGATRAATYLGLTCTGTLPERLAPLLDEFKRP